MKSTTDYIVWGGKGTGSVPVEAALTLLGEPYRVVETDWRDAGEDYARLNPMRQLPALNLPSGELMTESAAILIQLADSHPAPALAPVVKAVDAEPRLAALWAERMPFADGWEG